MTENYADRISGALGIALSASYVAYSQTIEDSMLADTVGASGVPNGVGLVMLLASAALLVKAKPPRVTDEMPAPTEAGSGRPHVQALGLLAVLVVYVLILPLAGYWISIALLLGAVAWLVGARTPKTLLLCAVLGASALWLLFSMALQVRMPSGLWPAWLGV
ncbi:MAG: tripartite tricarboxylate transporter TctB family protein [Polaromonas sp.]|nr:tripartite tricarboxylate transporter TctB family protein [Polaromonas sp.]